MSFEIKVMKTLGSVGREKMKTLHLVTDSGRFPNHSIFLIDLLM
jgi:hypothetical protein